MNRVAASGVASPALDSPVWSSSEQAHCCLRDIVRTEAFVAAIARTVRPGDTVVDAGAGSGILSLAAARAGAARVFAVEGDPHLAGWLRTTVEVNGFADRITVVNGNALTVDLPPAVDVVVAELIDTGLIDELQVPVLNALHARGVIGPRTRLIPPRYTTFVELVEVDDTCFGFRFPAPIHDWRFFRLPESGWRPLPVRPLTERAAVIDVAFGRPVEPRLDREVLLTATGDGRANAVRLTGVAHLAPGLSLGATNALNCDTIVPSVETVPVRAGARLAARVSYLMGGGLATFEWRGRE